MAKLPRALPRAAAILRVAFIAFVLSGCGHDDNGGNSGPPLLGTGPAAPAAIDIFFSTPELKSAGTPAPEVTITAWVRDATNAPLANVPVSFTADSGALSNVSTATDKTGRATATLGTGGDPTHRAIAVAARAGTLSAQGTVNVVGTTIDIAGPRSVVSGSSGNFTITVRDATGAPVANAPVSLRSERGNPIAVVTSNGGTADSPLTNYQGMVVVRVLAAQSGNDTLRASALGVVATSHLDNFGVTLALRLLDADGTVLATESAPGAVPTAACARIAVRYQIGGVPQSGAVSFASSLGNVYSDSTCTVPLAGGSVNLVNGDSQAAYLGSARAGTGRLVATTSPGGLMTETDVEFIAPLTPAATLTVQADPAQLGTNAASSMVEAARVTATVRDGTPANNPVKGASVQFAAMSDPSGGRFIGPSNALTDATGRASIVYAAGSAATSGGGLVIQAVVAGTNALGSAALTVVNKALFVAAGAPAQVTAASSTVYQENYAVFVADSAGNPVPNVTVTASGLATRYLKGAYDRDSAGHWSRLDSVTCASEDVNANGLLDAGEDTNGNGRLDPGQPFVLGSGTTDARGMTTIALRYPSSYATWLELQLAFTASIPGSPTSIVKTNPYLLRPTPADLQDGSFPNWVYSPFGFQDCASPN